VGRSGGNPSLRPGALTERPQLDDLAALAEEIELPGAVDSTVYESWLLEVRGRLRLLRHDVGRGIDDLRRSREVQTRLGWRPPMTETGPLSLALALPRADRGEALRLAREALELANASGLPRARGVALRAAALLEGSSRGIELLRESLALLEATPSRLEQARTLVELGAALRRDQRRAAAREPLRIGLERRACRRHGDGPDRRLTNTPALLRAPDQSKGSLPVAKVKTGGVPSRHSRPRRRGNGICFVPAWWFEL
jgi:hypothetical protein